MRGHRSKMQIMSAILDVTSQYGREGIHTAPLLQKANVSHTRFTGFVNNMTSAGLINKIEYDGRNTFVITERGRVYLESYKKIADIAESFGLEL